MFVFLRVNILEFIKYHRIQFQEKKKHFSSQMVWVFYVCPPFKAMGLCIFCLILSINRIFSYKEIKKLAIKEETSNRKER